MDVTVSADEPERIVVENQIGGPVSVAGHEIEPGTRYAVPPDAPGVQEAIMLGSLAKIRMKEDGE